MNRFTCKFRPGDEVIIGDDFKGKIDAVIFGRGWLEPMFWVTFWNNGSLYKVELYQADIRATGDHA